MTVEKKIVRVSRFAELFLFLISERLCVATHFMEMSKESSLFSAALALFNSFCVICSVKNYVRTYRS